MIRVEQVVKSFGSLTVLKGVDVIIPAEKVVAIVRPSGAGKTTLLQIMGTLSKADSGKVIIDGRDVFALGDKQAAGFRNKNIDLFFSSITCCPNSQPLRMCAYLLTLPENRAKAQKRGQATCSRFRLIGTVPP